MGIFKVNPAQLPEDVRERLGEHPISIRADSFLGLVSDQTDILHLVFDLLTPHPELAEGSLVTTEINNDRVVYQIVNATVKERGLDAQSVRGVLSVEAVKLGKWTDAGPEPVKWVPRPNTPVFLVPPKGAAFDLSTVGVVPRSSVYVRPDINRMVHHNTAIIGVLGAGKSTIAYQIIHRMIREGINVLVIDITDQYSISLSHLFREDENRSRTTKIQMAIAPTVNRVDQSPERGGNIVDFRRALAEEMNSFMDGEDRLWIVNPQHFDVTMQEGRPSGSAAAFRHLSMVEITKHVAEAALTKVQADGLSESARLCIVLEEAHSLVPEFNSAASKQDQEAAVGTARVVMQGRKYGLGFLVVTQRTANVSKSVLNQCHTVVALRNFDLRAQEFLEPYLGPHFVRVLPTLEQHHGIVYGPGFNLQQPLLVKFWDYEEFKNAALEQWGSQILTERGVGEAEVAEENLSLDDEVPF
ncbi:ATPase [Caldinitratiruptor microaerophilus]|uniref:ATPase n=1 Tax=Caldinitratiruptor microaerophilus TaxID=671077 RepID=A0AA35CI65_9FIRM|nr:ATPase [Caldinitratiruptor microaerophilus]